jgi:hypothetical protein
MGDIAHGPYPPSGFAAVSDADLGNGDCFGLYWPLGQEGEEPIVCDMAHDSWTMIPCFSNSTKLQIGWIANDYTRGDCEIEDLDFAPASYAQGKGLLRRGNVPEAIEDLNGPARHFRNRRNIGSLLRVNCAGGWQVDGIKAALRVTLPIGHSEAQRMVCCG